MALLRRIALFPLVVLAFACNGEANSAPAPAANAPAPVPVTVAAARTEDVPVQISVIGNVEPFSTVSIKSQVEGQLAQVHFREGGQVKKGYLLFSVDPRPFEAALKQAEANLARDRAEADNARVEADRRAELLKQGFVSRDEHDQSQARAASLKATVEANRAAIENAKLQLQYCSIRSPIDGRIGRILAHEGNVVKANDTELAVVNQIRPIYVAFSVPEKELARIRARAKSAPLTVEATVRGAAAAVEGLLTFIDNTVDTTTGTVLLKAEFANTDEALWPGQFVDVALTLEIERGVVLAPAEAVQIGQQGSYVFVVRSDDTVEVRPIETGRRTESSVVVTEGLAAGERVVTDGQIRLAAGYKVQIRENSVSAHAAGAGADGSTP